MPEWGPDFNIAGRYRLISRVGKGGMGEVWRAEHTALHSEVAIKLIDQRFANDEGVVRRFMQEARAAASLQSPYVVRTTDFGVVEGTPFIVMELLRGESLAERLERVTRLTPAETARVVRHVARAVGKAHEAGFVHRDLKPDNIFITADDEDEIVKVLDFGIAKAISGAQEGHAQTRTGAMLGTPYYMSPEQAQGDRSVDFRTDLWALGVISFECMVGKRPFDAEGLGSLVIQICAGPIPIPSGLAPVPPGFDEWFLKALCRDPAGRFQSARELSHALRAVLTPSDVPGAGTSKVQWPMPGAHRAGTESISAVFTPPVAPGGGFQADVSSAPHAPAVTPVGGVVPTPMNGVVTQSPTPWNTASPRLDQTATAAALSVPMSRKSGVGLLALLAVMGVVGLIAVLVVVRVVTQRAEAAPSVEPAATSAPAVASEAPAAAPTQEAPPPEASASPEPSQPTAARPTSTGTKPTASVTPKPSATSKEPTKPAPTSSSKGRLGF